jgi:hypothetical protein
MWKNVLFTMWFLDFVTVFTVIISIMINRPHQVLMKWPNDYLGQQDFNMLS